MNTEINLAIKRKKTSSLISTKKVKKLRLFALIFLFVVGGLSAALFAIIAASPLPALREQEQEAAATLSGQQAKFGKYLLIKSQLTSIQALLDSRPNLSPAIDTFISLVPSNITVIGVAITEETLGFGVTSKSLDAISLLFSTIEEKVQQKQLPSTIVVSPIAYSGADGSYSFTIDFR